MTEDSTAGREAGTGRVVMRPGGKDGPKMVRPTTKRWSAAAEARFLDRLAMTCNVTLAAEASGFSHCSCYNQRSKNPEFAARWADSLEAGALRLELMLFEKATQTLSRGSVAPPALPSALLPVETPIDPAALMSDKDMMQLLSLNRPSRADRRAGHRWGMKPAEPDKAREQMMTMVATVRRVRGYDQ